MKRSWHFETLPTITTVLCLILLLSLGVWQLKRLEWKTQLIHTLETRLSEPSLVIQDCHTIAALQPSIEYRHLHLEGSFDHSNPLFLYAGPLEFKGEAGYRIFAPFHCKKGGHILVDRGWVPMDYRKSTDKIYTPMGEIAIEGVLVPGEKDAFFAPKNDVLRNLWYWVDVPAMTQTLGLSMQENGKHPAPNVFLMQSPEANRGPVYSNYPKGKTLTPAIRNQHLNYAVTWFGSALALLGVFCCYSYRKREDLE